MTAVHVFNLRRRISVVFAEPLRDYNHNLVCWLIRHETIAVKS